MLAVLGWDGMGWVRVRGEVLSKFSVGLVVRSFVQSAYFGGKVWEGCGARTEIFSAGVGRTEVREGREGERSGEKKR